MSEALKGWAWVLMTFGVLFIVMCFFGYEGYFLYFGITGVVGSIPLFIASGIVKIIEQQRDTLYRIEELLEKDKTEE